MGYWRVEEAKGNEPAESCLVVIDPTADPQGLAECCRAMRTPELKQVHIVCDNRLTPIQVQASLKIIRDVMPNLEYVIRHTEPRIIALMGYLWRQMVTYCEKRRT